MSSTTVKNPEVKIKKKTDVTIDEWISLVSAKLYLKSSEKVYSWLTENYNLSPTDAEFIFDKTKEHLHSLSERSS